MQSPSVARLVTSAEPEGTTERKAPRNSKFKTPNHTPILEVAIVLVPLIGAVSGVLLARTLGPTGRGYIAAFTVGVQFVGFCCGLSLDKGLIHELAIRGGRGAAVWRAAWRPTILLSAAAALIGLAWGAVIHLPPAMLVFLGVGAAFTVLSEVVSAWAIGHHYMLACSIWRLLFPVLWTISIVLLVPFANSSNDMAIVTALGLAYCLALAISTVWLARATGVPEWGFGRKGIATGLISYSLRFHPSSMANFLGSRIDLIMAPLFLTPADVGLYAVALAPAALAGAPGSAIAIRGMAGSPMPHRRVLLPAYLLSVAGALLVLPWVLPWLFGAEFAPAVVPAQILILSVLVAMVTTSVAASMAARRQLGLSATLQGGILGLTVVGVAVTWWCGGGILGLALAVLVARTLGAGVSLVLARAKPELGHLA